MNDQDRAKLSAWMDGEADPQEEAYVLDRLLEDPQWQAVYLRWQTLRQQVRHPEPKVIPARRPNSAWHRWGWPALAMAASVTLAVIMWSHTGHEDSAASVSPALAARVEPVPGQARIEVATVAAGVPLPVHALSAIRPLSDDQRLHAYLLQHLVSNHAQLGSEVVNMAPVVTIGLQDDHDVQQGGPTRE